MVYFKIKTKRKKTKLRHTKKMYGGVITFIELLVDRDNIKKIAKKENYILAERCHFDCRSLLNLFYAYSYLEKIKTLKESDIQIINNKQELIINYSKKLANKICFLYMYLKYKKLIIEHCYFLICICDYIRTYKIFVDHTIQSILDIIFNCYLKEIENDPEKDVDDPEKDVDDQEKDVDDQEKDVDDQEKDVDDPDNKPLYTKEDVIKQKEIFNTIIKYQKLEEIIELPKVLEIVHTKVTDYFSKNSPIHKNSSVDNISLVNHAYTLEDNKKSNFGIITDDEIQNTNIKIQERRQELNKIWSKIEKKFEKKINLRIQRAKNRQQRDIDDLLRMERLRIETERKEEEKKEAERKKEEEKKEKTKKETEKKPQNILSFFKNPFTWF